MSALNMHEIDWIDFLNDFRDRLDEVGRPTENPDGSSNPAKGLPIDPKVQVQVLKTATDCANAAYERFEKRKSANIDVPNLIQHEEKGDANVPANDTNNAA